MEPSTPQQLVGETTPPQALCKPPLRPITQISITWYTPRHGATFSNSLCHRKIPSWISFLTGLALLLPITTLEVANAPDPHQRLPMDGGLDSEALKLRSTAGDAHSHVGAGGIVLGVWPIRADRSGFSWPGSDAATGKRASELELGSPPTVATP